jgi:hypothetical protein
MRSQWRRNHGAWSPWNKFTSVQVKIENSCSRRERASAVLCVAYTVVNTSPTGLYFNPIIN